MWQNGKKFWNFFLTKFCGEEKSLPYTFTRFEVGQKIRKNSQIDLKDAKNHKPKNQKQFWKII